jgi:hypothetical protein
VQTENAADFLDAFRILVGSVAGWDDFFGFGVGEM